LIALLELVPKKARTMSPGALVVTDGATKELLCAVNAPLCESRAVDRSMSLRSRMAPAAETVEANVHR
jgi:hypothetical protein